jgi:predicted acetyltransferase
VSARPVYGPLADEGELKQFSDIIVDAFQFPTDQLGAYYDMVGRENLRFWRVDGALAGGLAALPIGQFFGGRSVPMVGLAVVATTARSRGKGVAGQLLKAVLEELREKGVPISTLYPATVALYRRSGWEKAGTNCVIQMPADRIAVRDRTLQIREATPVDDSAIRALYGQWAATQCGNLDRSEAFWTRARSFRGQPTRGFVLCGERGIEGYVYLRTDAQGEGAWDERVHDLVVATPAAARGLLTFFSDYRTTRRNILWRSCPHDPLLMLLRESHHEIKWVSHWMLRIVDVAGALAARGYPQHVTTELHLAVEDDVLPANAGRYVLKVADGHGRVESGGRGELALDVRGLAALYSGFLAPSELVRCELATGSAAALEAAATLFSGPHPWMRDGF